MQHSTDLSFIQFSEYNWTLESAGNNDPERREKHKSALFSSLPFEGMLIYLKPHAIVTDVSK
jgi:hypothetical protein